MKRYKTGGILFLILEIIGFLIIVVGTYIYLRTNSNVLDDIIKKDDGQTGYFVPTNRATSSESMSLTLYIQDTEIAKTSNCGATKQIVFQTPKTTAVADASLKFLFSNELSKYGEYKSVSISTGGVSKVVLVSDMTPEGRPIGGLSSCESSHLMSVLRDTLTQYKNIKSVEIYSPKGRIEF